jgi:hypothetical protein
MVVTTVSVFIMFAVPKLSSQASTSSSITWGFVSMNILNFIGLGILCASAPCWFLMQPYHYFRLRGGHRRFRAGLIESPFAVAKGGQAFARQSLPRFDRHPTQECPNMNAPLAFRLAGYFVYGSVEEWLIAPGSRSR